MARRDAGKPAKPCVPLAQTGLLPQPLPKKRLFRGTSRAIMRAQAQIPIFQ
jgi:hypothetical protein